MELFGVLSKRGKRKLPAQRTNTGRNRLNSARGSDWRGVGLGMAVGVCVGVGVGVGVLVGVAVAVGLPGFRYSASAPMIPQGVP